MCVAYLRLLHILPSGLKRTLNSEPATRTALRGASRSGSRVVAKHSALELGSPVEHISAHALGLSFVDGAAPQLCLRPLVEPALRGVHCTVILWLAPRGKRRRPRAEACRYVLDRDVDPRLPQRARPLLEPH